MIIFSIQGFLTGKSKFNDELQTPQPKRNIFDFSFMEAKQRTKQISSLNDSDLPPSCRSKVMEQSPLISENTGYETIQIYR